MGGYPTGSRFHGGGIIIRFLCGVRGRCCFPSLTFGVVMGFIFPVGVNNGGSVGRRTWVT